MEPLVKQYRRIIESRVVFQSRNCFPNCAPSILSNGSCNPSFVVNVDLLNFILWYVIVHEDINVDLTSGDLKVNWILGHRYDQKVQRQKKTRSIRKREHNGGSEFEH